MRGLQHSSPGALGSSPGPTGTLRGVAGLAWSKYLHQLNKRPLQTKSITSACVAGLSDVIAQLIVSGRYTSWKRTLAVACFGFGFTGPTAHFWQKFMEYLFSGKNDMRTVLVKVLVDQCTYGPVCNGANGRTRLPRPPRRPRHPT
ncbi:Peroxisomal membrane protein PMP22 [Tetrabaena socialis]|uniref:Peroxisomal membrane protein PMP22 n=1 Tax=Tetrabaena socialis TaxID=47790 RepID=A0A2J7ZLP9_9CHLO|nr:Peroxisomal membrane protein PMP22 [Tetrabaena socialis]|eukprot:PNH01180.1 Peroxisomal membrane protein PMP22 [Tetrabaena socialis]